MGKLLKDMTDDERKAAIKRAAILIQRELEDNAEAISRVLEDTE